MSRESDQLLVLCEQIAELRAKTAIEGAFLAKSFTDRLLVVDVRTLGTHQSYTVE